MIACPRCQASFEDAALNYCGRCGSDMRSGRPSDPGLAAAALPSAEVSLTDDPMVGRVVDGRYRVLSRIGAGGMGAVYKVEHVAMGKIAALKMLHPTLSTDKEIVKRFRREAEAVSLLTHPNTVQVFDFGEAQGCLYMVMEYIRGADLAAILRREGPLEWKRAAPLLQQMCEALSEAHEAGIVHRDLKPENVLVARGRDGRDLCKVLDFGLAKLRQREEMSGVTARGSVIGTPYYMSPEQIRAEEPDPRSDIYSFGALMYRLLSGEHPFPGSSPLQVLSAHLTEPLVPMGKRTPGRTFEPRVEAIVARCMEKQRDARFPTIEDLRLAIEEARGPDHSPLPAQRTEPSSERRDPATSGNLPLAARLSREDVDRFERRMRLQRVFGWLLLPLVIACVAAAAWFLIPRRDPNAAVDVEQEPNNATANANVIESGRTVAGQIGKRVDFDNSDRDFFRLRIKEGTALLRLEVTGVPGMDLRLGLFDEAGQRLADVNSGAVGAGEVIPNQRVGTGYYYVEVREVFREGRQATENISDSYRLTALWRPLGEAEESEPDDTPDSAMKVALDRPVKGYLSRVGDVDFFRAIGAGGGVLEGSVSAIEGVDVRVVVFPPGVAPPGLEPFDAWAKPPPGVKVFDVGGAGVAEKFSLAWPGHAAQSPLVALSRKDRRGTDSADPGRASVVGVDVAYALTLHRAEGPASPP